MDFQVIEIVPSAVQRKIRIIGVAFQAALWTVLMFLWEFLAHRSDAYPVSLTGLALTCIFAGIMFALLMYFLPLQKLFRRKKNRPARVGISIESDRVSVAYKSAESTSWTPGAVVRKGMVRSIFKIPGGIGVSERGQFGARMLGFMVIPNTVPNFNEIRALLESWRVGEA